MIFGDIGVLFSQKLPGGLALSHQNASIYDLSLPIGPSLVTWPGDPKPRLTFVERVSDGRGANVSELCLGSHTGTHVDAPAHFVDGAQTIDAVPLDVLIGPARLLDMTGRGSIARSGLASANLSGVTRVLFKTDNSRLWRDSAFHEKFTYIEPDAAAFLASLGVKLVGVDYLSVEKPHTGTHPTHHALLDNGVIAIEGLDLSAVPQGDYELICLPLKVAGAEAAPARVILRPLK